MIRMKRINHDMLHGPLLGNIITYAIPIMLTGILQLLFHAADLVVVGQFRGSVAVAAVGATGSLTALIVNLFIGLSTGAGVTVAHAIGSKDAERTHRTVHTAVAVSLVGGVVLAIIGFIFCEQFLIWMDTPADVLPLSTLYMRIYFTAMPVVMLYNFCSSLLRAAGDTKNPLTILAISGVINVVLNIIFVTVFGMSVDGVALATVISTMFSAVMAVIILTRRTDALRLELSKLRIYKLQFLKILRIGLPAGIQSSIFAISNVLIQSSINSFGEAFMSGNAAASNIDGFVYTSMNSFYQTSVNFIGQNAGARQYKRIKQIFWRCTACVTVLGIALGSLMYLFGRPLLGIYITDSAEAVDYGMIRLACVGLPYFFCGIMEVATGALRGMGVSVTPMIISILGVCGVRIGWILTVFQLPKYHTPESLYFSYLVSWVFTAAVLSISFLVIHRKRMRQFSQT